MNVERGFLRLTAVVSAVVLIGVLAITVPVWNDARRGWAQAIAPSVDGQVSVFVSGLGIIFRVPASTSQPDLMKRAAEFEAMGLADLGKKAKEKWPQSYGDLTDEDLGKKVAEKRPELVKDLSPMDGYVAWDRHPGEPPETFVDYVYLGKLGKDQPRLYTREELLREAEKPSNERKLPPVVKDDLVWILTSNRLPAGASRPSPLGLVVAVAIAVGAAAVPWVIFFVLRWILRGFKSA